MTWCQGNRARLRIREREHSLTATPPATSRTPEEESVRLGTIYGFLAYGMWGILPIYFRSLEPASAWEILAHRIVWSFLFCIIIWTWRRDLSWLRPILRSPRRLALLSLAAFVLAINWGVFIWAVSVGNVVESSLGYFINPLFLVLMGVILLGERMNRYQWTAIGFGALAVAVTFLAVRLLSNTAGGLVGAAVLRFGAFDRARVPCREQPRRRAVRVRGLDVGGDLAQLQRVPAAVELPLVIGSQVGLDQVGDAGRGEGRAGHDVPAGGVLQHLPF